MYFTTTVKKQPLCRVILRLRLIGTIPGGYPEYPDQLRGCVLTVVMISKAPHPDPFPFEPSSARQLLDAHSSGIESAGARQQRIQWHRERGVQVEVHPPALVQKRIAAQVRLVRAILQLGERLRRRLPHVAAQEARAVFVAVQPHLKSERPIMRQAGTCNEC